MASEVADSSAPTPPKSRDALLEQLTVGAGPAGRRRPRMADVGIDRERRRQRWSVRFHGFSSVTVTMLPA